jgi:hypothetical protein
MPVVLSDRDARSIWAQLEVLRHLYEREPQTEYREFELGIVRRHLAQLSAEPTPTTDLIRAVR